MVIITTGEKIVLVEAVNTALAEVENNDDISQGVVDRLHDALEILGVHYDEST